MNNSLVEKEMIKYFRIKTDLIKMARCIDSCNEDEEREAYQNACLEYSKELKNIKKVIEESYGVKVCGCCFNQ